jgi:ribosomal protein S14
MKYIYFKNLKKIKKIYKAEKIQNLFLSFALDTNIDNNLRCCFWKKHIFSKKRMYINHFHNFCLLTNNSRSVLPVYNISRTPFRFLASYGFLYGITKSSW